MNYIRHLNGFFIRLAGDQRMTPYHISLYLALFQHWNAVRFGEQFVISRSEMMQLSRIGSANTYARCMKELSDWGYIIYTASSNLHLGSRVSCVQFDTETDTTRSTGSETTMHTTTDTGNDTASDSSISGNTERDTGEHTAIDTGGETDIASDTTTDTGSNTGTSCDLKSDSGTGTPSDTGIAANIKPDTGRSRVTGKNDPAGIKSDTGTDTASDTVLINNTNSLNKKESQSENDQNDDSDEKGKKQERKEAKNYEDLPDKKFRIPDLTELECFFEQNRFSREEARKFYAHYQSSGWKTGNKTRIVSWQAIARKWIENNQNNRTDEREFNKVGTGKLSVTVNKNYNEPL